MLISTKGRYALRVLVDLAEHQTTGYLPLKEVAERQEISEKYLEIIIKALEKACEEHFEKTMLLRYNSFKEIATL